MRIASLLCLVLVLPASAAETRPLTVDDLMKVRNVLDPRISPDGTEVVHVVSVADLEHNRYDSDLWLIGVKDRRAVQLTRSPGRDDTPRWSPDGKTIAFISDRSGSAQLWLLPRAGGDARKLTSHPTAVGDYAWSPDGKSIAFLARDADSEEEKKFQRERGDVIIVGRQHNSHLHLVDVATGQCRRLTEGKFHVSSFSWSPDGKTIACAVGPSSHADDEQQRDISLLNVADGKLMSRVRRDGLDSAPRFSPDGRHVAFLSRNGSSDSLDQIGLAVVPVEGGKPRWLSVGNATLTPTLDGFTWTADGSALLFEATRGTTRHLCSLSLRPNQGVQDVTPPTAYEGHYSFSADGKRVAFLREGTGTTSDVWYFERTDSTISPVRLTDANPQLRERALGKVELIRWKSKDGLEVEGLLVKPVGFREGQRYPTIAYVHGGPANQFMQNFSLYPSTIPQAARYPLQVFAGQGYAILCPNPRGSGSYGADFRKKNVKDWGGGDFDDIMSGLDELIKRGVADADRVGIMGWSYGGFMTAWAITQTDRFKAASFGAGLTNLASFHGQTDIPSFMERYWGGPPWEQRERYAKRSAMSFVALVKTPTLIQHGEKDERVPLAQSQELYTALKRRGVPVEMAVYPRQGHNVTEPRLQRDCMTRNVEWFNRWLKK